MRRLILLVGFLSLQFLAFSQTEDAWVYFTDKENVAQALANPITILTQRAIDRKADHGITIDARDVPVNEAYIAQIKTASGITVLAKSKWFNAIHVRGTQADIEALQTNFAFVDSIEFASYAISGSRAQRPTDNHRDKFEIEDTQVDFVYGDTANQVEMITVDYLHEQDFTGTGVLVAVLDAGFPNVNTMGAFQRLRDAGNLLDGYDFVDRTDAVYDYVGNSHGTRVLSTMAGFVENQYVGTAPDAQYYVFRTEDAGSETPVEESYWVEAAERSDSLGVDIINTSLGYKTYDNADYSHSSANLDGMTAFITRGANIAFEKGLLLINSAGNSGASGVNAPADSPFVMSIGAVDANGNYASFSSQGNAFQPSQKPNVVARGAGSFIVDQNNNIGQNNGTSFSSPILAGAMACLMQALPSVDNDDLMQFVHESSSQYTTPDFFLGYGIPNFEEALNIALSTLSVEIDTVGMFPNPASSSIRFLLPSDVEQAEVHIHDITGKLVLQQAISSDANRTDISQLSNGVYLVNVTGAQSGTTTYKLLKE